MLASTTLAFLEESYKIYLLSRYVLHPPISKILTFAIIYPIIIISSLLLFHSFIYSLIHLFKMPSLNSPKFQFPDFNPRVIFQVPIFMTPNFKNSNFRNYLSNHYYFVIIIIPFIFLFTYSFI